MNKMNRIAKILLLAITIATLFNCRSNITVNQQVDLNISIYRDPGGNLSFSDIVQKTGFFKPASLNHISEGYTPDTIWVKADLFNASDNPHNGYLILNWGNIILAEYHVPDDNNNPHHSGWRTERNGLILPLSEWNIPRQPSSLKLNLAGHSRQTVFIKLSGIFQKSFPVIFMTDKQYSDFQTKRHLTQISFGILLLVLVTFNIFLFILFRDEIHVWYILFILNLWTVFFFTQGDGIIYFMSHSPDKIVAFTYWILPLAGYSLVRFYSSFLQIQRISPFAEMLMIIARNIYFLLYIPFLILPKHYGVYLFHFTNVVILLAVFILTLYAFYQKLDVAKIIILPMFFYLTAIGMTAFHFMNLIQYNLVTALIIMIVIPVDLVFFSAVLFKRVNELKNTFQNKSANQEYPVETVNSLEISFKKSKNKPEPVYLKGKNIPELKRELHNQMSFQKPWLEENFNTAQLAARMDLSIHQVSELLNKYMGVSFAELTNQYRLNETFNMMKTSPGKNMLEIALSAGFQSKSAFNRIFKEKTGLTPTEYMKNLP